MTTPNMHPTSCTLNYISNQFRYAIICDQPDEEYDHSKPMSHVHAFALQMQKGLQRCDGQRL